MRNGKIRFVAVAVFAVLALTEAASAFYSPAMGRFLSRDPIGEPGAALVQSAARPATDFIPRDPIDQNGYAGMQNNAISWFDPDGGQATTQPTSQPTGAPTGISCGIEKRQSPFCLFGNPGHTWLTWGSGEWGYTAECPNNYINYPRNKCEKDYLNNIWDMKKVDSGQAYGTNKPCKNATCDDIKACLRAYAIKKNKDFNLDDPRRPIYHCRMFADEAASQCCLQTGRLWAVDPIAPLRFCCSKCARGEDVR